MGIKSVLMDEVKMLLAEKRTSLSVLRTGLALFSIPISVLTILTAASQYYEVADVIYLFIFLVTLCIALLILGSYLIFRAIRTIRRIDFKIKEIKTNL